MNLDSSGDSAGTLAKIFTTLASAKVNIEIINSTQESAICIVNKTHAQEGIDALRKNFAE